MRKFKPADAPEGGAFFAQSNQKKEKQNQPGTGPVAQSVQGQTTYDDDLLARLNSVMTLSNIIDNYYKDRSIVNPYPDHKPVHIQYSRAYEGAILPTQGDAELFLKKVNKQDGNSLNLKYSDDNMVERVTKFLTARGTAIVGSLNETALECMEMYDLSALNDVITKLNNKIQKNMMAKQVTETDIRDFETMMGAIADFKKKYDNSRFKFVQDSYKKKYISCNDQQINEATTRARLVELKGKYSKKLENEAASSTLSAEDKALQNPAIVPDDVTKNNFHYTQRGNKAGRQDEANQQILKQKKMYSEDAGYSIYKKGKDDTHEVAMNDAIQGYLGDCYLISSIASVAKANPKHAMSLIEYDPKKAIATVTLYIRDKDDNYIRKPKDIPVSFYFPMQTSKPVFEGGIPIEEEVYARKADGEFWVMLIEKAYATELGSYNDIVAGDPYEALSVLTGKETAFGEIPETDADLLTSLTNALTPDSKVQLNRAVIAGTKNSVVNPMLVPGHAYSVLNADASGVELRNPQFTAVEQKKEFVKITLKDFRENFSSLRYSDVP